jgi:hypothetical protein
MNTEFSVRRGAVMTPLAFTITLCLVAEIVRGDSVTLTPSADAELREITPQFFNGSGATMVSGGLGSNQGNTRRRALMQFDLAEAIPSGATVTSVELKVQVVHMLPPSPVSSNFELHRLLRHWREAATSWAWADNPGSAWDAAGASAASDAVPSPSASVAVSGLGQYVFSSTPELVADVQLWVDNPESNAGWLLRSNTEAPFTARHFGTREVAARAASLTVGFELVPALEPVTIRAVSIQDSTLTFAFEAQAGVGYKVEFRDDLMGGDWSTVTNIPSPTTAGMLNVNHVIQGSSGFYRVESAAPGL